MLCRCTLCASGTCSHPVTKIVVAGKLWSRRNYTLHLKESRYEDITSHLLQQCEDFDQNPEQGELEDEFVSSQGESDFPSEGSDAPPDESDSPSEDSQSSDASDERGSRRSRRQGKKKAHTNPHADDKTQELTIHLRHIARQCQGMEDRFHLLEGEPMSFQYPPTPHETHPSADVQRDENRLMLERGQNMLLDDFEADLEGYEEVCLMAKRSSHPRHRNLAATIEKVIRPLMIKWMDLKRATRELQSQTHPVHTCQYLL